MLSEVDKPGVKIAAIDGAAWALWLDANIQHAEVRGRSVQWPGSRAHSAVELFSSFLLLRVSIPPVRWLCGLHEKMKARFKRQNATRSAILRTAKRWQPLRRSRSREVKKIDRAVYEGSGVAKLFASGDVDVMAGLRANLLPAGKMGPRAEDRVSEKRTSRKTPYRTLSSA